MKINLSILFFVLFCSSLFAQTDELEFKTIEAYRAQMPQYQEWLEWNGISNLIQAREMHFQEDTLTLYLEFPTENYDSVMTIWDTLKVTYDDKATIKNELGELLLYAMLHVFEVPPSNAKIELYDSYTSIDAYLEIEISYKNKEVLVLENPSRSSIKSYNIPFSKLKPGKIQIENDKGLQKEHLYKEFFNHFKHFYKQKGGTVVKDEPGFYQSKLIFQVDSLRKEIFEDDDILCRWYKWLDKGDCPVQTTEMLDFSITINFLDGDKLEVTCEIEAWYGSGWNNNYNNRKKANLVEDGFKYKLDKYTNQRANEIFHLLANE